MQNLFKGLKSKFINPILKGMAFFSERKRIEAIQQREKAGENLWSKDVAKELRNKIERLVISVEADGLSNHGRPSGSSIDIFEDARELLAAGLGVSHLYENNYPRKDMLSYLKNCEDDEFPNAIEAFYAAIDKNYWISEQMLPIYEKNVNELLESYRISYSMENGEVIEFESREVHQNVVLPALRLVAKEGWDKVEKNYVEAIREISNNHPSKAITSATTAMQEMLRTSGCTGKDFSALLSSAKATIFKGADTKYIDGINNLIDWLSATRANSGNTHVTASPSKADAWLVVHLVGILILHISEKTS